MSSKKARMTVLAMIATLCLAAGMLLGGGYAFAEPAADAPTASVKQAVVDKDACSTTSGEKVKNTEATDPNNWFNYQYQVAFWTGNTITVKFTEPIAADDYDYVYVYMVIWGEATDQTNVDIAKTSGGAAIASQTIRTHYDKNALTTACTMLCLPLASFADESGKADGFAFTMTFNDNNPRYLLFNDFTCYTDDIARIDIPASGMTNAAEGAGASNNWGELFTAKSYSATAMTQTVRFANPVTVNESHKYAVFNAMFWGAASWVQTTVTANGNSAASESVYILDSYDSLSTKGAKIVLPLEKLANAQNTIESITFSYIAAPAEWSGYFLISDFQLTAQMPDGEQSGTIDYRRSGLMPATDTENWNTEFTYQKMPIGTDDITLYFSEAVDTARYYAATLELLVWGGDTTCTASKADGTEIDTFTVRGHTDKDNLKVHSTIALRLSDYAEDGKASAVKLRFASGSHLVLDDFIFLETPDVPAGTVSGPLSGFSASVTPAWSNADVFDWEKLGAVDTAAHTYKIPFVTPVDVALTRYAQFDILIWSSQFGADGATVQIKKERDGNAVDTVVVAAHEQTLCVKNDYTTVTLDLDDYKDADGKVKEIFVTLPAVADGNAHLALSNFRCSATEPAPRVPAAGTICVRRSTGGITFAGDNGGVPDWKDKIAYQFMNSQSAPDRIIRLVFESPVDIATYPYMTLPCMFWIGGHNEVELLRDSDNAVINTVAVVSHCETEQIQSNRSEIGFAAADFAAAGETTVSAVKIRVADTGDLHFLFDNFVCHTELPAFGKLDALSSSLTASTLDYWKEKFPYETSGYTSDKTITLRFSLPVPTDVYKSASFHMMYWAATNYYETQFGKPGETTPVCTEYVEAEQNVAEAAYDASLLRLDLTKFADADGKVRAITVKGLNLPTDTELNSRYVIFTDFTLSENELPAQPERKEGEINPKPSGLSPAQTVSAWSTVFKYEKMNAIGQTIKLVFYKPIDVSAYKYAEFDMLLWTKTNWYDITVENDEKSTTVLVPAYESMGVVDTRVGLPLASLADENGKIDSLTFVMPSDCGTYVDKDGNTKPYNVHFLVTDFTLKASVPETKPPKEGEVDYKRSGIGLVPDGLAESAMWKSLFTYRAEVNPNSKLTLKFAVPLDARAHKYAVVDMLLWGSPDFVTVPVSNAYGSDTLEVYKYWASEASQINAEAMRLRLDITEFADADGKVHELTFDFAKVPVPAPDSTEFGGNFLFSEFFCVNMATAATKAGKDIAELLPIGAGKTFTAAAAGDEGAWTKHASARTSAYDALRFGFSATYSERFTFGLLVRTLRPDDTVRKSGRFDGVLVELGDAYAQLSVWNGDNLITSRKDGNFFTSGESVRVELEILETTLANTPCGYTLRLTVGDTVLDDVFVDLSGITFGYYTHILTANSGEAFTVTPASTSETPVSAAQLMDVRLCATATDGKTKRVPLALTYNKTGGETVSRPVIEGNAHYDEVAGYLVFDGDGEVTVSYTVTNDFGTFESNTLTLSYTSPEQQTEVPQKKSGCGGSAGFGAVWAAVALLGAAWAALSLRKKRI